MIAIEDSVGRRIMDAGHQNAGQRVDMPAGRHTLWLVSGRATWQEDFQELAALAPSDTLYELTGPGTLEFIEFSSYVWIEPSDPLGFGERAALYRGLMETRNRGVGQALAAGLTLRPEQIWVDIGTGTGAMVQALQEQAPRDGTLWIFGIDQASGMIDQAWAHSAGCIPAWFVGRDVSAITWPNGMVDGITALLLLHLVKDLDPLLVRIYGALKPGGVFAYAVSSEANPFVRMVMHQLAGPGDFFKRGQQQVYDSVLRAGFEILSSDIYEDEIVVDSPEEMRDLMGSIGAAASRGLLRDITPPTAIVRQFDLIWARKPSAE